MSDRPTGAPNPPTGGDLPSSEPRSQPPVGERARSDAMWTVAELLDWTQRRFTALGLDSPRIDAEHLLAHALGCSRMQLYVDHDEVVDAEAKAVFREHVKRRLAREPVAYIEGRRGFHALGLELAVDARVLIPRPETEHLVDWVLDGLRDPPAPPMSVLDVGTGSGAIALAIKHARSDVDVVAVDVSSDAVDVARSNARSLKLEIDARVGDLMEGLERPDGGWAAIAANLPYIATQAYETLPPDIVDYEPRLALDGGPDGLDVVRRLILAAAEPGVMASGAGLYLEVGYDQADAVRALLADAGFERIETRPDYAGIPRMVRASR